jgi:acyl-CoA synthetase (AMP-forming)/AMP-acid ligase II
MRGQSRIVGASASLGSTRDGSPDRRPRDAGRRLSKRSRNASAPCPTLEDIGNLREILLARAAQHPDRLAFDDGRRRVTYRELLQRASGQATRLASAGVRPGDRVALAMSAGVSFAEAFWAAQLLGAATCAFNPHVPAARLERRVAGIRPRLTIRDGDLESAAPVRKPPPEPPTGPEDLAYLQPTSGTSGKPRAAMLLHRTVLAYLAADDEDWATEDGVFVDWVPPWHDYGLIRFIIGGVWHGAPCHIVEPAVRTIPEWLATIGRVRGTVSGGPDFAFRLALRMVDPRSVDLGSLRNAGNGGEPVRLSSVVGFEEAFGVHDTIRPGYGLAEATLGVTANPPGEPHVADARGNVALGPPRAGLQLEVEGNLESPGEIRLRGEAIFAGYFDAPEDTAAALKGGWLHTGDVGYYNDGNLYVLGRERAMIKRGGAVIAPRELEEVAEEVEGVRIAVAVGLPDAAGMTETAVVAVEHDAAGSPDESAVARVVSRRVMTSVGFAPERVAVLPRRSIPRTENGKIRHGRLRELLEAGVSGPELAAEAARA